MTALTNDGLWMDVEVDPRPPSVLRHILNEKPDRPAWKDTPRFPPLPEPISHKTFEDLISDIDFYYGMDGIKKTILLYAACHDDCIDLSKISDKDLALDFTEAEKEENYTHIAILAEYCRVGRRDRHIVEYQRKAREMVEPHTQYNTTRGPFLIQEGNFHRYRLLHPLIGIAAHLSFARHWKEHATLICPAYLLARHLRVHALMSGKRKQTEIELHGFDCRYMAKRMIKEILHGHVMDQMDNVNLCDEQFLKYFCEEVEEEKNGKDLVLAVDKFSPEEYPRGILYCCVAQKVPKIQILPFLMAEYNKYDIDKNDKEKQITWATDAACRWGHFEAYRLLSKLKKNFTFETLRCSVLGKNPSIVENLMKRQNWTGKQMEKALEWACLQGQEQVYNTLREFGAFPTTQCLFESAIGGNIRIFMDIFQSGIDLETVDQNGGTVLHAAAKGGNVNIVQIILQTGTNPNTSNKEGRLPLHVALDQDSDDVAELLLFSGTDPNAADSNGMTLLHKACSKGNLRLFELVLNTGGDIQTKDSRGRTLLHRAVFSGNVDLIDQLTAMGFDPEEKDLNENTLVHYAALQGHTSLVEKYVDMFPHYISYVNKQGWNPLMCAAVGGHFPSVYFLVKNGADSKQVTCDGQSVTLLAGSSQQLVEDKVYTRHLGDFDERIDLGPYDEFFLILDYFKKDTSIHD